MVEDNKENKDYRDNRGRAGALRASDTERGAAVSSLATHFADGRLERAEFDERADAALAARTRDELRVLFADLPGPPPLPELSRPGAVADADGGADGRADRGSDQTAAHSSAPAWAGGRGRARGRGRGRGSFRAGGPPLFPLAPVLLALSVVAVVHGLPPFPLIALFAVLAAGRRRRRWNRGDLRPWH
jgi:Domain of unknown function (DUF1707)